MNIVSLKGFNPGVRERTVKAHTGPCGVREITERLDELARLTYPELFVGSLEGTEHVYLKFHALDNERALRMARELGEVLEISGLRWISVGWPE